MYIPILKSKLNSSNFQLETHLFLAPLQCCFLTTIVTLLLKLFFAKIFILLFCFQQNILYLAMVGRFISNSTSVCLESLQVLVTSKFVRELSRGFSIWPFPSLLLRGLTQAKWHPRSFYRVTPKILLASTISSLIGEVMITSSDGDYLREVTSRWQRFSLLVTVTRK